MMFLAGKNQSSNDIAVVTGRCEQRNGIQFQRVKSREWINQMLAACQRKAER